MKQRDIDHKYMTKDEIEIIGQAITKCKEDIENSIDRFNEDILDIVKKYKYPDSFVSEKEQEVLSDQDLEHENN